MTASAAPSTSTVSPAPTGTKPSGARWRTSPERRPRRCPSPPTQRATHRHPGDGTARGRPHDRGVRSACSPRPLAATASRRNTAHPSRASPDAPQLVGSKAGNHRSRTGNRGEGGTSCRRPRCSCGPHRTRARSVACPRRRSRAQARHGGKPMCATASRCGRRLTTAQ